MNNTAQPDEANALPSNAHESYLRHPIRAAEHEVEHLKEVADEGENAATPAIMAGGVLAVVIPLGALLMALSFGVAYLVTRGGGGSASNAIHAARPPTATPATATGATATGKTLFAQNCSACHGLAGTGGNGGPDLTSIPSAKQRAVVIGQITDGGGGMPAFKGSLTNQQIRDVAAYVVQDIT